MVEESASEPRRAATTFRSATEGDDRNRTGVNGFAGRCVTTPPRRRSGPSVAAAPGPPARTSRAPQLQRIFLSGTMETTTVFQVPGGRAAATTARHSALLAGGCSCRRPICATVLRCSSPSSSTNAIQHGGADERRQIEVRLSWPSQRLRVEVRDPDGTVTDRRSGSPPRAAGASYWWTTSRTVGAGHASHGRQHRLVRAGPRGPAN